MSVPALRAVSMYLLGLAVLLAGMTLPAAASEQGDTTAPEILALDVNAPTPLAPGETFTVWLQASEPVHVLVSFRSPSGTIATPEGDITTAGVTQSFPATVGTDYESGTWTLDSVMVTDAAQNAATYYRDGSIQNAPGGVTGPTTHAFDFYPESFTVLRAPTGTPTNVTATAGHLGAEVTWAAAADSAIVTSYRVTAAPGGKAVVVTAPTRTARFTGLAEGPYTFTVTPVNRVGDGPTSAPSNEVTAFVDTQAPVVTIWNPVSLPYYNRNTTDVIFKVDEDGLLAKTECSLDGATFMTCASGWKFTRPSDGEHEIRVRSIDTAGNGSIATRTFTEDHTAPVVRVGAQPNWTTNQTTARFSWTMSDAVSGVKSWTCELDGRLIDTCTDTGVEFTSMSEGDHHLVLAVRDRAGNGNVNNVYLDWDVDLTAPTMNITQAPAANTQDPSATIAFTIPETWSYSTAECQVDDQPFAYCGTGSVTYSDLTLGEHRAVIRIQDRAGNPSEKTLTWTVVQVPDAPGDVHAVPGDQEALVYWTRPAEYGLPVTGYVITASPGGKTVTVPADRTGASVSGLTNGTAYTFTVTATTSLFDGSPASAASNEVTPAGWPDMPRQVTAQRGEHTALVSWAPADGRGAPITGYTVTVSPGDRVIAVPGDQTSVLVDGLDQVGPYTLRVTATTWVGDSAASYPASVLFAEVPSTPTGVKAVRGNHSALVSWTPPADDGGIALSDYTITVEPGGLTINIGTETTSWTVTGLTNGTGYTFTVLATNPAGPSAASAPSNRVVPAGVPSRVARPDVARTSARGVVVRWKAPNANYSPIKRYRITPNIGKAKMVTADVRKVVFSSLRRGRRYEFTVVAINGVGSSRPSLPGGVRIP